MKTRIQRSSSWASSCPSICPSNCRRALSLKKIVAKKHNSGQVFIEYILFLAIVLGVVVGVLKPILSDRMNEIAEDIRSKASVVVSQRRLGIPIEWFFGEKLATFQDADTALDNADPANNGGFSPEGADGPSGDGSGPGGDNSPDPSAGGPSFGGGDSGPSGPRLSSRTGGSGGGTSTGDQGEAEEDAESRDRRSRRRSSGDSGFGATEDDQNKNRGEGESLSVTGEETATEDDSGAAGGKKTRVEKKDERQARRGCADINIFTILKIVAILVILFLAGAVAVSSRGNKGRD